MSETVGPISRGSYDDVPDEDVATVLNVPLRLSNTPATSAPTGESTGLGRHRKPDPPVEPLKEFVPPTRHATAHNGSTTHWHATLKVGAISAAIVFGAAALALVALTWLP